MIHADLNQVNVMLADLVREPLRVKDINKCITVKPLPYYLVRPHLDLA